jgi:prefoldin subunit 5
MVSKSVNTAFNKIGDKRISQLSIHSEIAEIVDPDYQMKVNIPQWITTPIARSKWHLNGLAAWIDEWENRKRKMEREDTTSLLQEQLNLVQKEIQTIKLAEGEMLRKKATISAMKGPPQKIVRSNHEFEREFYYLKRKDQKLQEKHLELKKNISLWHEYYNSVNKILSAIQARERNERLLLKVFETRERDCFDSGNRQHSTTESKRLRERDEIFINRLVPAMERRSSLWEIWDTGMTGIDISTDISQRHLELVSNVYTTQWALDWLHS